MENEDKKSEKLIKTFTIDWNSEIDVTKLFKQIKSRYCEVQTNRASKRERHTEIMNACTKIINTEISHLYTNINLNENKNYYVYAHLDTSKKIAIGFNGITTFAATLGMSYSPFYVGKGIGNRCNEVNRNETHRKIRQKLSDVGKDIKIIKLFENISEKDALCYESKLIDIFGLVPYGGRLTNLDEGLLPEKRRDLYKTEFNSLSKFNSGMSHLKSKK